MRPTSVTPRGALRLLAPALPLLFLPDTAAAHPGTGAAQGLLSGFAHPLLGWDHLLAMVAVGIWAGQAGGRSVWALPAAFVAIMAAGGALGAAGMPLAGVETGIVASLLVLGALIALAAHPRLPVALVVVALSALFHGHAHGAEMPELVGGVPYGAGFTAATALLHALGVGFATTLRRAAAAPGDGWVRAAGAAIGVAGLVLWLA